MSFKSWLSIITLVLVGLVLFVARNDIADAWRLLGSVDLGVFLLIVPAQFLSYYAHGAMIFSYLKQRGDLKNVGWSEMPRMALELNFVNHVFPTAGVSGVSFMTWRLNKLGVSSGRATLAQFVKFAAMFIAYAGLLVVATILVTVDVGVQRTTILAASGMVTAVVLGTLLSMCLLGDRSRLKKLELVMDSLLNIKIKRWFRLKKDIVKTNTITEFFDDLHSDYMELRGHPKYLLRPLGWGVIFNFAETLMFFIAFWSLGYIVNPAPILIGQGLAGMVAIFFATPGGAGGYEAILVLFLAASSMASSTALAGVLLARTSMILLTIASGYVCYNSALKKYGKHEKPPVIG
ncbi:flippase-like domain-containing protein [Candidatus Saccharibacteria bacterium]|nr:flippase-like domain-containing protein [Candidatus Saccharibacteria bacterium]